MQRSKLTESSQLSDVMSKKERQVLKEESFP